MAPGVREFILPRDETVAPYDELLPGALILRGMEQVVLTPAV